MHNQCIFSLLTSVHFLMSVLRIAWLIITVFPLKFVVKKRQCTLSTRKDTLAALDPRQKGKICCISMVKADNN